MRRRSERVLCGLPIRESGSLVELAEAHDAGGIVRVGAAGALSGVEGGEQFLRVGETVAVERFSMSGLPSRTETANVHP